MAWLHRMASIILSTAMSGSRMGSTLGNLSDTTGHWELCSTQWQTPVRRNRTLGTLFNTMANTCQTQQDIGNSVQHNGKHLSDTTGHWELCSTQWQTPVRHNRTMGTLFNIMRKKTVRHSRTLGTLFTQWQEGIQKSVQHCKALKNMSLEC